MLGITTSKHIAKTNDITKLINRGINLSPLIYVAVKNNTFEAINITVIIKVIPLESRRNDRDKGEEGVNSRSQVIMISWLLMNVYSKTGINRIMVVIRKNPALIGCQIVLIRQGEIIPTEWAETILLCVLPKN